MRTARRAVTAREAREGMVGQGSNMDRRRGSDHQDRCSKEDQLKPGFLGTNLFCSSSASSSSAKRRDGGNSRRTNVEDICQNPLVRPVKDKTR